MKNDPVNHPSHYANTAIEVIDYIDDKLPSSEVFCLGNVIKYVSRYDKKAKPIEDLEKAQWYLNHAIDILKRKANEVTTKEMQL